LDLIDLWFSVALFLLGLALGSFANVVIWRFPRGESVVSPGSSCPHCGSLVRWFDNVPVISWLLLRARCRACHSPISPRYPIVELLSALLWLVAALFFGVGPQAIIVGIFFWVLLVLSFIDIDTMRLPNPIVGALAAVGLAAAVVSQFWGTLSVPLAGSQQPLVSALLGALLGAGLSGIVAAVYSGVRGRAGFGMGDVKLLGAMGLFLGPYVLLALMTGSVIGTVYGIAVAARTGSGLQSKIPFGPFLAVGGVATAVLGPAVVEWYTSLIGIS